MSRLLLAVSTALTLAGCASYTAEDVDSLIRRGDCSGAEALMQPHAQKGDAIAVNNLGVIAENCRRNQASAIGYYTLAARMGAHIARTNLARLGQPVPVADLQPRGSTFDPAALALGLTLLQGSRPAVPAPPPPTNINCTSRTISGTVYTNCR